MNNALVSAIGIEPRGSAAPAKAAQKPGEKATDFAALLGGGGKAKASEWSATSAPSRSDTGTRSQTHEAETRAPRGLDVAQARHERNAARQAERRETVAQAASARAAARGDEAAAAETAAVSDTETIGDEPADNTQLEEPTQDTAIDAEPLATAAAESAVGTGAGSSEAAPPTAGDGSAADAAATAASPNPSGTDPSAAAIRSAGDWLSTIRDSMRLATAGDPAATVADQVADQTAIGASNGLSLPRPFAMAGDALTLPDTGRALAEGLKVAGTASVANDGPPGFSASLSVLGEGAGLGAGVSPSASPEPGLNLAAERALSALPSELNTLFALGGPSGELPSPLRSATAAPVSAPAMTLPPDHPDFAEALGERIVWITDAGLSSARIEMNPQQLGAVSVNVQLKNDEAQVSFTADNPATRALLMQTMPQLRELFAGQGLQLMRSQVEQRSSSAREGSAAGGFGAARGRDNGLATQRVSRLQLVDAYA